jgi:hypothetical protein
MKHERLTLRARLQEIRYWYLTRPVDRALNKLARALPDSFRRRVWYSVTADATTGPELGHREVPAVTITEVMQTFPTTGSGR